MRHATIRATLLSCCANVLSLLFAISAVKAAPLVVRDANGKEVGEVLQVDTDPLVPLRVADRIALVAVGERGFLHRSFGDSFRAGDTNAIVSFDGPNCTGKAYMVLTLQHGGATRGALFSRTAVLPPGDTLHVHMGERPEYFDRLSWRGPGSLAICWNASASERAQGRLLSPIVNLRKQFAFPLRIDPPTTAVLPFPAPNETTSAD